ncbi:CBY1-interacting BAR domain-containing protein 1-like isoform X5 [Panulirus ornatus]|uniref:CBY1-interacting BAR domain-containing protein 1-like isoform X5 n=1 Tax=Panulirus ornatus TaxID=150431 RepID=UPI003A8B62E6
MTESSKKVSMFSSSSLSKVNSDQTKFIQERIAGVEKHFAQICSALGAYTRKTAKLRDKGDEVSQTLMDYGEVENLNKSLRSALCETADTLAAVQDYRNVEVQRLETRVVGEISLYGGICKTAREELKRSFDTRQQEMNHRRNLEKTKMRHPQNRQHIVIAETKLQKATLEARRACENLEEQMDQFEQRKVADLKKVLREFIQEFRNALKGDAVARAEVLGAGKGSPLSPVITSSQEKKDSHRKQNMKKSMEKLQVEDYEEVTGSTSSEDD